MTSVLYTGITEEGGACSRPFPFPKVNWYWLCLVFLPVALQVRVQECENASSWLLQKQEASEAFKTPCSLSLIKHTRTSQN